MDMKDVRKQLLEQSRIINGLIDLIDENTWYFTSERKPSYTRVILYTDGSATAKYGYYVKPRDKWYTDVSCEKEMREPIAWREVPDVPEKFFMMEVNNG